MKTDTYGLIFGLVMILGTGAAFATDDLTATPKHVKVDRMQSSVSKGRARYVETGQPDECQRPLPSDKETAGGNVNVCDQNSRVLLKLKSASARTSKVGSRWETVVNVCIQSVEALKSPVAVSIGSNFYDGKPARVARRGGGGAPVPTVILTLPAPFNASEVKCGSLNVHSSVPPGNLEVQVDPSGRIDHCDIFGNKTCTVDPRPTDVGREVIKK